MIQVTPQCIPEIDPGFIPAVLWNRAYRDLVAKTAGSRDIRIALERPEGIRWVRDEKILPAAEEFTADTRLYIERMVKFLLWSWGAAKVKIAGAPEIVEALTAIYCKGGKREFDWDFMGAKAFLEPFCIEAVAIADIPELLPVATVSERGLPGNRIGFDLGGSDRKAAAMVDGEVVFSEEIKWNPYFETDPEYHRAGIRDSIQRAAAHLPDGKVDAIGGSSAGIIIDNEPRVASLFRGIDQEDFRDQLQGFFKELKSEWGGIPFDIANDGDVTAIAGAMAIDDNAVLGVSMGTSLAAGYINPEGQVTGWINELAFVPVDYRDSVAIDEWSGDAGCGVQYFSQQGVGRLLKNTTLEIDDTLGLPEKLEKLQEFMAPGDERAAALYRTIGVCFGYAIAHFADFYTFRHLLFLGRVSTGDGGDIIMEEARRVLDLEFPDLSRQVAFQTPDEKTKRHGQAIAAASLPKIS